MKIKSIKREAHIGTNIELSNVEQVVLATKLNDVSEFMLDEHGNVRSILKLNVEQSKKLNDLVIFLGKLTDGSCSLQEAHNELFNTIATDYPLDRPIKEPVRVGRIEMDSI